MIDFEMVEETLNNYSFTNRWTGTPLEKYAELRPKAQGLFGEAFVKVYIKKKYGLESGERENDGHDAIITYHKTEIKFSTATERNYNYRFTFNHIGIEKDWDRIIFMGINGDLEEKIVWFTKDDIKQILATTTFLAHQAGGKNSKNDDYMSMGIDSRNLLNHPLAKSMDQWS